MHLHQFFINNTQIINDVITISGTDAIHIIKVLRLKEKDKILVIDEHSNKYQAIIENIIDGKILAKILETSNSTTKSFTLNLYASILKGDAWISVLKKSTELGVDNFFPVISERTIVKICSKEESLKIERWNKIVYEASKQSKRNTIPLIFPISTFNDAIINADANADLNLIFWEDEKNIKLKNIFTSNKKIRRINAFIGPEGGFTNQEIEFAKKNNVKIASLGKNILRADTATLTAIAILNYELE